MPTLSLTGAVLESGLIRSVTLQEILESLAITEKTVLSVLLDPSITNFVAPFGGVAAAKFISAVFDKPAQVRVNGITNPLMPINKTLVLVDAAGGYSSLHLTNPSSTDAVNGVIVIAS